MTDSPWPHAGVDARLAQLHAAPSTALSRDEIGEQRAVAAADVEHPRAGLDHLGDQPQIAAQLVRHAPPTAGRRCSRIRSQRGAAAHEPPSPRSGQPAVLGAAGQKAAQGLEQLGLVQQEGVVALVGLDLDKADIGGDGVQRMDQLRGSRDVGNSQSLVKEMMQNRARRAA